MKRGNGILKHAQVKQNKSRKTKTKTKNKLNSIMIGIIAIITLTIYGPLKNQSLKMA